MTPRSIIEECNKKRGNKNMIEELGRISEEICRHIFSLDGGYRLLATEGLKFMDRERNRT